MHESSKSVFRKLQDSRYATRYLVGNGIDIGAGTDCIAQYYELFPLMRSCRAWDLPNGDAQTMEGVADNTYDFVHSSRCLEYMRDVPGALENWLRILKPGGHMICMVPDEDLYEQGVFPSTFNPDHRHTFTMFKRVSWSTASINVVSLLSSLSTPVQIKKIELLDATYRYDLPRHVKGGRPDQTVTPVCESAIEFIVKKL